jgi:hypothetical protein
MIVLKRGGPHTEHKIEDWKRSLDDAPARTCDECRTPFLQASEQAKTHVEWLCRGMALLYLVCADCHEHYEGIGAQEWPKITADARRIASLLVVVL